MGRGRVEAAPRARAAAEQPRARASPAGRPTSRPRTRCWRRSSSFARDALVWAVNERMKGRPGATIVLRGLAVSVGRADPGRVRHNPAPAYRTSMSRPAMSNRFATRIGLPIRRGAAGRRPDLVAFHEPAVGAPPGRRAASSCRRPARPAGPRRWPEATREALEAIEHDYYYDLSAGVLDALTAVAGRANRRLYHQRRRLGIPRRSGDQHRGRRHPRPRGARRQARAGRRRHRPRRPDVRGPAAARGRRGGSRIRRRRVAATLGEALEVEPFTWQGGWLPATGSRLVSRHLAQTVGVEELQGALAGHAPGAGGRAPPAPVPRCVAGPDPTGCWPSRSRELAATATTHQLEPVRPADPLAGLPDQSPVPLADAIGRGLHRAGDARGGTRRAPWAAALTDAAGLDPRLRAAPPAVDYPRAIPRTAEREAGRRRRIGPGRHGRSSPCSSRSDATVAALPSARPTEAIPRAAVAREAIAEADRALAAVEERVDGADLVDRDPERATELLADAHAAVERAAGVGVADGGPRSRCGAGSTAGSTRCTWSPGSSEPATVVDLAAAFERRRPGRHGGRQRRVALDPRDRPRPGHPRGSRRRLRRGRLPRRPGARLGGVPGDPWLIATAATDVVVIDRERTAWRIDLAERVPRRCR